MIVHPFNLQDEGYTALNLAGYKGFVEILELLLQYGAEVNATTDVCNNNNIA